MPAVRTAATATRERDALKNRLAWLSIDLGNVPEDATLTFDGRERAIAQGDHAGVSLLGVAAFATFGSMSAGHDKSLEDDCNEGLCPPGSQDDLDKGKQDQLFANIGLGVGIASRPRKPPPPCYQLSLKPNTRA